MDGAPDPADFACLDRLVRDRHSCRAFQETVVPHEQILRMVETAQQTASDCNIQPWRVTIAGGHALARLRAAMYEKASHDAAPVSDIPPIERYQGTYLDRRRACGWSLYNAVGIERGDRVGSRWQALENFRFFGAPHLAVLTTHASLGPRALLDCGGYVSLFMLAAQALGVASVPQAAIAHRADVLREHLEIPADDHIVCGIAFGYADESHAANAFRTSRAPIDEVVVFRED